MHKAQMDPQKIIDMIMPSYGGSESGGVGANQAYHPDNEIDDRHEVPRR